MPKITNPHDRYFQKAMSVHQVAESFFRQYLPEKIRDRIDFSTLSQQPITMISEKLTSRFSDLIYKVNIDGKDGYIYLLAEHQSTIQELMAFRLLEYVVFLIRKHLDKNESNELPVVIPIVLYNGKCPYTGATDLFKLFGSNEELARSTLCQLFHLIDLNQLSDDELQQETWTSLMMMLLKHARSETIFEALRTLESQVIEVWKSQGDSYIMASISYIFGVRGDDRECEDEVIKVLHNIHPEIGGKAMTIADRLRLEGEQIGMQQGKKELAGAFVRAGVDIDLVAKIAQLSREEIEKEHAE